MKKTIYKLIFTAFLGHFYLVSIGQGLILDSLGYDTLPRMPLYDGKKGLTNLASSMTLRVNYCPKPVDQGAINSCVAFACGYGAYTVLQAKNHGWFNETATQNAYSAAYIFNQIGTPEGMVIKPALTFLKDNGICRVATFPNSSIGQGKQPSTLARQEAQKFRIKSYEGVDPNVFLIKKQIEAGRPVILGAKVEGSGKFREIGKNQAKWWFPQPPLRESHALLIVGYDDTDGSFEIMNSYGPTWGNGGFIKIKQTDLITHVFREAYTIILDPNSRGDYTQDAPVYSVDTTQKDIIGKFSLKNLIQKVPNTEGGDSLVFEPTLVHYNKERKLYETHRQNWHTGEAFQFFASTIPTGNHLYAFSFDPTHKITVHWPPDARWAETDKRTIDYYTFPNGLKPISAVIPSPHIELTIPSPDEALQLNKMGEDKLIVLITTQPIQNFKERLDRFATVSGDVWERLNGTFGKALTPTERLVYYEDKMIIKRFVQERQGWITPMVLAISVK